MECSPSLGPPVALGLQSQLPRARCAVVVALLLWPSTPVVSLVSCDQAPNCTALQRYQCDPKAAYPHNCGGCLPGAHGQDGRMNSACLVQQSCAAIFPGQTACTQSGGSGPAVPFIVPFGRCSCDDGTGLMWPTAPGKCAQIFVAVSGLYTLQKCSTRTCDPASCSTLTTWLGIKAGTAAKFDCRRSGSDSLILSDGCNQKDTGTYSDSALCGHPGFMASKVVEATNHAVNCELAPKCPESVLGGTRLEQSCCKGNPYSAKVTEYGVRDLPADGFCSEGLPPGQACMVTSTGPGWKGCSCLNSQGQPRPGRQCTVECTAPGCEMPKGGIPRTPEAWLTSEVPRFFFQAGNIQAGVSSAGRPEQPRVLMPLLLALGLLAVPIRH